MVDVPEFKSEREEADWWDTHPDEAVKFIERAEAAGAVHIGVTAPPKAGPPTTIRLIEGDIERARKIAHRKGLRYQTFLKMMIHEGLDQAEKVR